MTLAKKVLENYKVNEDHTSPVYCLWFKATPKSKWKKSSVAMKDKEALEKKAPLHKKQEGWSATKVVPEGTEVKEELSQEVKDKIKSNNDKMTELKKNGGSQEDVDKLEKENDELNGGNETFEEGISNDQRKIFVSYAVEILGKLKKEYPNATAIQLRKTLYQVMEFMTLTQDNQNYKNGKKFMPDNFEQELFTRRGNGNANTSSLWISMNDAHQETVVKQAMKQAGISESLSESELALPKLDMAMKRLANKPTAKKAEFFENGLKTLIAVMSEKSANNIALKNWSTDFLKSVQKGIESAEDNLEDQRNDYNDEMNYKDNLMGESLSKKVSEAHLSEEKKGQLLKGKVRYFDSKRLKGAITGDNGKHYEIVLSPYDENHKKWALKIKEGMSIKFKIIDSDDMLVEIGDFSF